MKDQQAKNEQETRPKAEFHTMPERFFESAKKSAPKPKKRGAFVVALSVFILLAALLTGAVFVLYRSVLTAVNENRNAAVVVLENRNVRPPAANLNVNAPANANAVANVNANANVPVPEPPVIRITSTKDTDLDGLTDAEETLYGTLPENPDTDGDGYLDGNEVFNLFSPTGITPKRIFGEPYVKSFENRFQGYRIIYPASWLASSLDESQRDVLFTSGSGDFVEVSVERNPQGLSLVDWYLEQSPGAAVSQLEMLTTNKSGHPGIKSPDRLTAYVSSTPHDGSSFIYVISYNAGLKRQVDFLRTFNMMLNSIEVMPASTILEEMLDEQEKVEGGREKAEGDEEDEPAMGQSGNANVNAETGESDDSNVNSNVNAGVNAEPEKEETDSNANSANGPTSALGLC